jgi:hypothetical protein
MHFGGRHGLMQMGKIRTQDKTRAVKRPGNTAQKNRSTVPEISGKQQAVFMKWL